MNRMDYLSKAVQARGTGMELLERFGPEAVLEAINFWYRWKAGLIKDAFASDKAIESAKVIKQALDQIQGIEKNEPTTKRLP